MGLMIGIWLIAFIGFILAVWTNNLLKEQDERLSQLKK